MTRATLPDIERITMHPGILAGKPVVRGTRIPVSLVLAELAYQPDMSELFQAYPDLTVDDVKACLSYARALVERVRPARIKNEVTSNGRRSRTSRAV